jgi:hypothetical protein
MGAVGQAVGQAAQQPGVGGKGGNPGINTTSYPPQGSMSGMGSKGGVAPNAPTQLPPGVNMPMDSNPGINTTSYPPQGSMSGMGGKGSVAGTLPKIDGLPAAQLPLGMDGNPYDNMVPQETPKDQYSKFGLPMQQYLRNRPADAQWNYNPATKTFSSTGMTPNGPQTATKSFADIQQLARQNYYIPTSQAKFGTPLTNYLQQQQQASAYDGAPSWSYNPFTKSFSGATMGGQVNKSLQEMRQTAQQANRAPTQMPNPRMSDPGNKGGVVPTPMPAPGQSPMASPTPTPKFGGLSDLLNGQPMAPTRGGGTLPANLAMLAKNNPFA